MQQARRAPARPRGLGWIIALFVGFLLVTGGFPAFAEFYTDLWWFDSVGQKAVFTKVFATEVAIGTAVTVLFALVLYINGRLAFRFSGGPGAVQVVDAYGRTAIDFGSVRPTLVAPAALVLAALAGLVASNEWATWLKWWNAEPFGLSDPLFGRDAGFYVFTIPVIDDIRTALFWLIALSAIITIPVYSVRGALLLQGNRVAIVPRARMHLSILGGLLFLVLALDAWLASQALLNSELGPVSGASYADVHATLLGLRAKAVASVVGAGLVFAGARRSGWLLPGLAVAVYVVVNVLGVRVYPSLIQRLSVKPNEAVKEAPYIEHNIAATRYAYGLDKAVERELSAEATLTYQDIENNRPTVDNIRLWDHGPLLQTFAQIQEIRTYYDFKSVDNDRYMIDGELRQTMLSPRELGASSLPNRTWINEHFTFTHGYGITLGPVNEALPDGLPKLYIQDIPPKSSIDDMAVTQPAIYFGELPNEYVFVKSDAEEFDYPSGDENVYASYEGKAGVGLGSLTSRALMSMRFRTLKLILSQDLNDNSRVLLYRNIKDRVRRVAPFLLLDRDPYMVVGKDGGLFWIQDAYTYTNRYPYSQPTNRSINYIRNSVKVVVDAYHGSIDFYVNEPEDPILNTWRAIFPELFKDLADMPEDLRAHLRYPETLFQVQTQMFSVYHMKSAVLVYNREDQWEVPAIQSGQIMQPYYTIMRLPQEDKEEFILMLPFTPKRKQNLSAWMVARSDGEHRGQLVVYRFPKDRLIFGPRQVMNRINQDAVISEQRTLWNQQGSQATFGTLLVIPIEESLIYVAPLYLLSGNPPIPELKRVIVVYGNTIAMRETLDEAISAVFEGQVPSKTRQARKAAEAEAKLPAPRALAKDERVKAKQLFDRAIEAQRRGDWAAYGKHLKELERVLDDLADDGAK